MKLILNIDYTVNYIRNFYILVNILSILLFIQSDFYIYIYYMLMLSMFLEQE